MNLKGADQSRRPFHELLGPAQVFARNPGDFARDAAFSEKASRENGRRAIILRAAILPYTPFCVVLQAFTCVKQPVSGSDSSMRSALCQGVALQFPRFLKVRGDPILAMLKI